jgi:hypothetical protein
VLKRAKHARQLLASGQEHGTSTAFFTGIGQWTELLERSNQDVLGIEFRDVTAAFAAGSLFLDQPILRHAFSPFPEGASRSVQHAPYGRHLT